MSPLVHADRHPQSAGMQFTTRVRQLTGRRKTDGKLDQPDR